MQPRAEDPAGGTPLDPVHTVSEPIRGIGQVVVIRVDNRDSASRAAFDSQKEGFKQQAMTALRRQRVSEFLSNLKAVAKIDDRRKQVESSARRAQQ